METRNAPAARAVAAAAAAVALTALALPLLAGCSSSPDDGNAKVEKLAADANGIADRSGGDWSKLTPSDRTTMLNIAHGNERAARELLYGLSGKTHEGEWGTPEHPLGGPPGKQPGPPAGPPAGAPKS